MKALFLALALGAAGANVAAAQSAYVSGNTLRVSATKGHDSIWVVPSLTHPTRIAVVIRNTITNQILLDSEFPNHTGYIMRVYVRAGPGNDRIYHGTSLRSALYGDPGNDYVYGGSGPDVIYGGTGNDSLMGGAGNDWIDGDSGSDYVGGGSGNDTVIGGSGQDTLDGQAGDDRLHGGDSEIFGEDGVPDWMIGGSGKDYFTFEAIDARVGNYGLPGGLPVSFKWWQGYEPWIFGPYDSFPKHDPRGYLSPLRYWNCKG